MKKLFALLLAVVMVMSLAACNGEDGKEGGLDENGRYTKAVAAVSSEIQNLLPTNGNGNPKAVFFWNIYETLFDFNEDLEFVPDLAKSFEIVDPTHWQVHLFEKIYDSAGNHITAEDVVFSVEWLRNAGEDLNYELFDSVKAVDDYTVEYTWKETPTSTSQIEFPFTRTFIFDKDAFDESKFATAPVATGNYTVQSFITGSEMVLKANPDYWALKTDEDVSMRLALHNATVDTMTYRIIQESSTAEIELQMGNIDYCDYIKYLSLDKFQNDSKYVVEVSYSSDYSFLGFNMDPSNILSDDLDLRMAICYALDSQAVANAMPGSYSPMKTYGTPYFKDYDPAWEKEPNYANTYDQAKAKEYLAKSKYAANGSPTLTIICKSSEADKNAVQMMLGQLMAVGINVEMKAVDQATFQTDTSNYANWDLMFFNPMSGKDLASSWRLAVDNMGNKRSDGSTGSIIFHGDQELFDLYKVATADATHTTENMKKVIDHIFANAYVYPVAYSVSARVYRAEALSKVYYREGYPTLCASTYAGQQENKNPATHGQTLDVGGDVSAVVGEYTFTEVVGEGSGKCEYKIQLNADGTYRIDQHNMFNEDVWIEGTFVYVDGKVVCAAPEAGVQGAMDRFLNSGWTDVNAPATTWILNGDGTATPEGYVPADPTQPTEPEGGDKPTEEVPGIVTGLEGNGFERFTFYEVNEGMGMTFTWYVMKSDGMVIVITPNDMLGTADGLGVWHFTEVTEDKGVLTLSGLEEADKALPTMGDQWSDRDNFVQQWQIFGMGLIAPANWDGFEDYKAAVEAGEIPPKAEEPSGGETEVPGIVAALTGQGYECFSFTEESPFGTFPWYVLKKDGEKTIVVTVNENLGGETVWHFENTEEDKGLLTLSGLEEGDKALPTLGDQWSDKDNFVQKWQITGMGAVVPAGDK